MKTEFFPLDLDYSSKENEVRIFGRTKKGDKIIIIDNSINSYFWVIPKKDADKITVILRA